MNVDRYQCKDPHSSMQEDLHHPVKKHAMLSGHCQLRLERPVEDRQVTDNVNDTADNDGAMIISDLRSFVSSNFESILFIEFIFTFLYVKYEVFYLIEIAR